MKMTRRFTGIVLIALMLFTSLSTFALADVDSTEAYADQNMVPMTEEGVEGTELPGINEVTCELSGNISSVKVGFKWEAVEGASYYEVVVYDNDGREVKRAESDYNTAEISGLNARSEYKYSVTAYKAESEVPEGEVSELETSEPIAIAESKDNVIQKVEIGLPKFSSITYSYYDRNQDRVNIKWSNPASNKSNVNYEIYYGRSAGSVSTLLSKSVSPSGTRYSYTLTPAQTKVLTVGDTCYFKMRVYAATAKKVYEDTPAYAVTDRIRTNHDWYAKAKKTITVYKSSKGSSKLTTMKKGQEALAIGKYPKKVKGWNVPKRVQIRLSNGKVGWVSWGSVSMVAKVKSHDEYDYSKAAKEKFVKNYSSKTGTLIWVSRYTQHCYIFKGKKGDWNLYKTYKCTTANFYQPTYGGVKEITGHKYKVTKVHKSGRLYYFRYSTSYHGSGTMHTRCKWTSNNKWRNSIKVTPSTKGCVRLPDEAAIYIYKLGKGTAVIIK